MVTRGHARLLVAPGLLLVAGVFLAPFLLLVAMSFWSQPEGTLLIDPTPTLENYRRIFSDDYYLRGLGRTLWLSLATVVISLVLGFPVAFWIVRRAGRFRRLVTALVLLPMVCGALLPTLGLVNILSPLGLINGTLKALGLIDRSIPLLGTQAGILIGLVQAFLPLMVLPLVAVLDRLPPSFEEAAMSLGARPSQVWRRVVFPLSAPGVLAGSTLVFCAALTSFVTPQILGQGKIATFAAMTWQQASLVLDWPFAAALAMVMLGLIAVLGGLLVALRRRAGGRA
ncbi:ABC transporter permease [Tropicimonas sediminicola]|uniref:Putative spermidine/putrescine transport system permease protein n=1 Tax=Tropicimonas sediminicola TaxID=1031541 RepID=A0A239LEP3_9RHOB|nr:ABC transporter permease [Tropicimonas sediminicola]SNT28951.1 putative spermidine/putrescine transport system permease protein [Tropicimonas sediminicola]